MKPNSQRPVPITILCSVVVIGTLIAAYTVLPKAHLVRSWFPPLFILSVLVTIACAVGMWLMRKWSVYLYAGWTLGMTLVGLSIGVFSLPALLIRLVVIAVAFYYICWRSMAKLSDGSNATAPRASV